MGSDIKGVNIGICCEHGKVSDDTENDAGTNASGRRVGSVMAPSSETSIGSLAGTDATVGAAAGNNEDRGGRGMCSEMDDRCEEVALYCSEDGQGGHQQ